MRILDFANYDDAMETSDAVDISQGVEHEVLIGFHVAGIHLDLEVVIAGGVVAFRYLVDGLHGIHELLNQIMGVLFQSDITEHNHVVSHLVMIHYRSISLDVSLTLQSLLSFEGGRRGEVYSCGKFLDGESRVLLQQLEYLDIDFIEIFFCSHCSFSFCFIVSLFLLLAFLAE